MLAIEGVRAPPRRSGSLRNRPGGRQAASNPVEHLAAVQAIENPMGKGRYRLTKRGLVWYAHVYENGIRRQVSTRCTDVKAAELALRQLERDLADPAHAAAKK